MKRLMLLFLALLMLLAVSGCKGKTEPVKTQTEESRVPTTLMVYMIGSDLEAKSGAGTNDLEELANSGIDLGRNNVLVFAGGSRKWHNDDISEECSVLKLTTGGFESVETVSTTSMGEADTLTYFLDYCMNNYSTDRYALVMWDHGNGPVMGYGKDELYDGDALLLSEMKKGVENSVLAGEKKLAWVGFDACLMASAELVSIWDEYAEFLVASQEVEPSFGWNYSVFGDMDSEDTKEFLNSLGDAYISSCEEYYERKGLDKKDTTLSCVDLVMAAEMESCIDSLFKKAASDVEQNYNKIAVSRVKSRGLGRATTGSEYDLVDFKNLVMQLGEHYPDEAKQLTECIDKLVVFNKNNTEDCCGLSLYFPFYNKSYNQKSWNDIYNELGLYPEYLKFMEQYRATWLESDKVEEFATSIIPEEDGHGTYVMPLTKDQNDSFVSAKYYILRQDGDDIYTCVYTSPNVKNLDGLLVAEFDGKVLYIKDQKGYSFIPPVECYDTVAGYSRYSTNFILSNRLPGLGNYMNGETESRTQLGRMFLALNEETDECVVSGISSYEETAEEVLSGGKVEEVDLNDWGQLTVLNSQHRYMTRDDNGVLLPWKEWNTSTKLTGGEFYISDGVEFAFDYIEKGSYYVLIEVQDTQGNGFCSELLAIEIDESWEGIGQTDTRTDIAELDWTAGEDVTLYDEEGVCLKLELYEDDYSNEYRVEITNENSFPVRVEFRDLLCNRSHLVNASNKGFLGSGDVESGATENVSFNLEYVIASGDIKELESLQLSFEIRNNDSGETVAQRTCRILTSAESTLEPSQYFADQVDPKDPFLNARAKRQTIYEDERVKAELLGFGGSSGNSVVRIENLSEKELEVTVQGVAVNGLCIYNYQNAKLDGKTAGYLKSNVSINTLDDAGITEISSLKLLLCINEPEAEAELHWCDIDLSEKAQKTSTPREEEKIIYEENGIRIALSSEQNEDNNGSYEVWNISLYNGTDDSIFIDFINEVINGTPIDASSNPLSAELCAGPGQYASTKLSYYYDMPLDDVNDITFNVQVLDYMREEIIFTSKKECKIIP